MKLSEHVDKLRTLIEAKFDRQFASLGLGKTKPKDLESLPEELHPKRQRYSAIIESHIGETGDYVHAREKLVDELTFTLFNRFAAVKVMEAANLFPPVLTKQPEHGDRSFGHKAWLEVHPDMRSEELEGIREYIKHAFDELGETLPLYSKKYPYALLPDAISLNEIIDAFNAVEKDSQVDSDIWQSDDVLGWLYESYNNVKKKAHKDSGDKTEYDKVSLQSQVYTPRWVVQFLVENSLGKLYLEMHPTSDIRTRYKIANAPHIQERKPKPLHEIKIIDPACGSGNFLLYAFDFFYELYIDQIENYGVDKYEEKDIPKWIIEHNLHGIDLDDRAVQLAQLGLFIKAKKKRTIEALTFKVVSSDFFLPDYEEVRQIFEQGTRLDQNQRELIQDIWKDLTFAYKFGSLIRLNEKLKVRLKEFIKQRKFEQLPLFSEHTPDKKQQPIQMDMFNEENIKKEKIFYAEFINNLKSAVEKHIKTDKQAFLSNKTRDAVIFLELLTTEYDVATANPPYTDSADFGPDLKEFIEDNYKKPYKFHTNLYATFLKRCYEMTEADGKIAMIHPLTFMYIKTFKDVRKFILSNTHIDQLIEFGLGGVFLTKKVDVDVTGYVLSKDIKGFSEQKSFFMDLQKYKGLKIKRTIFEKAYEDFLSGKYNNHNYILSQSKLKIIKFWPFIYWISDTFRQKFNEETLKDYSDVALGLKTANNNKYLRYFWEINRANISFQKGDGKKWVVYLKGGEYNKWIGNEYLVVEWSNDGERIKKQKNSQQIEKGLGFRPGVTLSTRSSKGVCGRLFGENRIFDMAASAIVYRNDDHKFYWVAYSNSKFFAYVLNCLNPTVNKQPEDIRRLPVKINSDVNRYAAACINIKSSLLQYSLIELTYKKSPYQLFEITQDLKNRTKLFLVYEKYLLTQVIINEAIINKKIFENFQLSEHDKAFVLAKEGESIGGLPVSSEAKYDYLAETETTKEFPLDNILQFIESLQVKDFSSEERETIESGFPTLYQGNNNLEDFCIRHQVNPINVWYWFKQNNVIPEQRMHTLAMEFLADMIREILMEDEDGIIPLVPNAGEKILLDRIEEKFRERGFSSAQYASFDSVLGRPIHEYLTNYFFTDLSERLNLFRHLPKTPFIWHLSSGPEQGFDCYIIIYKWSRDKLMRLRSVSIEHRERSLVNRQSDLANNESAEAQNEKDRIFKQLKEIESFKSKIDELLSEGYAPILDDGVGKNIAPLQNKKMIPYEVLNAGQLKKYLNADW